ncbi:MAG: Gfo/Idh/MocA family oxidoreductase [Desulfobacteraceae bacterium]|nr:Gfo/Idh/MocA family oxidoreductase [Desulfobacteraceae bacterium]
MNPGKRIRAAVVGVGYLGRFHAEKYAALAGADLIGVADTDRDRALKVGREVGTKAYTDYTELFGKVDAVSIAVPTALHYSVAKAFLEAGADVLIEKPITRSVAEADELIDIAEKKGRIVQVGHLERFNPAVKAVRDLVETPLFIECNRLSLYQPRGTDVSVVHDLMIHDIDLILNFVKSGVSYCHAMGAPVVTNKVDIANAHLEFENMAVANVTASRISSKSERKIRIFQQDGYFSIDFANRSITHIHPEGSAERGEQCPVPGMRMETRNFEKADALADEIRSFVSASATRNSPEVSGRMGRDALAIAVSIIEQIDAAMQRLKGA